MTARLRAPLAGVAAVICLFSWPALGATPGTASKQPQRVAANVAGPAAKTAAAKAVAAAAGVVLIETVVVTAEKRTENSQRVPIAITAMNGDSLNKHGVTGFRDLSMRVPSLRFGSGVTGGENVITMRGLGSVNTTPGGDSPVAYSVDGVTLQRSTSIDPEFYDVDRVEVLRGPQGTLYGRNSVGGSINVITKKPSNEFSAGVDAMVGNYDAYGFRGFVNGPLSSGGVEIDGRLTAVYANHGPYSTNLSTAPTATHNQDAENYFMIRGQLNFEFNPDMNLLLSVSTSRGFDPVATNTAWWETPHRYMTGSMPIAPGSACDFSTQAKFRPRTYCHDATENAHDNVDLYSGTFNWNLGWAQFTSVSALSDSSVSQTSDGDGSILPMAVGSIWILRQQQLSEELRLTSHESEDDPLRWIVGFYYFWANNFENFAYNDTGLNGPVFFFDFRSHGNTKTRSFAPFGQADFNLAKTSLGIPLTVTAGVRFTDDRKYGSGILFFDGFPIPTGPQDKTWSQWTGTGKLTWQVNDDVIAYASAARGYISGGDIIGLAHIYGPESAWSYEAGVKSQFLDNRLQLNVAAYHEEIQHLQVFIQSGTASTLDNVKGLTQVNGLETEITAVPVENLNLNATLTLTHATYGNYPSNDARFGGSTGSNFRGMWLNQTPPYSLELGADYTFHTSFGTITPRVDVFFSGRVQFLPDNYFTSTQHAYSRTDLHVAWSDPDERYRLEVFVHNLENAAVISNDGLQSITLGEGLQEPDNFAYYPPRVIGARFGVRF
jgi:iron complex outermembrane receptor protein